MARLTHRFVCPLSWDSLTPVGADRACDRCERVVVDLSQLEEQDAIALVRRNPDTCGRTVRRSDGTWVRTVALSAAMAACGSPAEQTAPVAVSIPAEQASPAPVEGDKGGAELLKQEELTEVLEMLQTIGYVVSEEEEEALATRAFERPAPSTLPLTPSEAAAVHTFNGEGTHQVVKDHQPLPATPPSRSVAPRLPAAPGPREPSTSPTMKARAPSPTDTSGDTSGETGD